MQASEETVLVSETHSRLQDWLRFSDVLPHAQNKLCRQQKHAAFPPYLSLQAWELPGWEESKKWSSESRTFNLIVYCNQQAVTSPYLLSAGLSKRRAKQHNFLCIQHSSCLPYWQRAFRKYSASITISDLSHGRIRPIPLYFYSHRLMKCAVDIYRTTIVNSICIWCLWVI